MLRTDKDNSNDGVTLSRISSSVHAISIRSRGHDMSSLRMLSTFVVGMNLRPPSPRVMTLVSSFRRVCKSTTNG
jgi:hypothetical protein